MKILLLSLIALTLVYAQPEEVKSSTLSGGLDLSNYKKVKKKEEKIVLDSNISDVNGIYNYKYSPNTTANSNKSNILLNGNFDKIQRYDSLYFDEGSLDSNSQKTFDLISKDIHAYLNDESQNIIVSVLGFTQKIENKDEGVSLGTGYTNFFQSVAQRDNLNPDNASEEALNFMEIVYEKMLDDNISSEVIYKENRVGKDNLYTEEFSDGRALNNRVDIAIYVKEYIDPDTDGDGVTDSNDYCPGTPLGSSVDVNGCPLILSLDLKFDFDKATISDKKSLDDIKRLSKFMTKYSAYHANIIGHTDSVGKAAYNKKLSIRRAEVVKKMIIKDDVNASRLSYEGRGESEPLFENINPFNRHKNRRTEVELTLPKEKGAVVKLKPRARGLQK